MNKILQGAAAAAAMITGCLTAQAQTEQPQGVIVDQIVAVVGSSAVLYSDVEQYSGQIVAERRERGYTLDRDPMNEALEGLMLRKLLYHQSLIDSVQVNTNNLDQPIDEQVQEMIRQRGSVQAVEAFYRKPIFDLKEDLRQRYTEMQHAQAMQGEIMNKVTITPGEVDKFFRSLSKDSLPMVPEQYVYAQITKFPPSIKEAKQRVRERLIEMRERIMNGTSFSLLARMYSVDGSAARGGEMDPSPKEAYVAPFADALAKLKPGQVSEVVETEFGFHLIELIGKDGNLYHCRHILLRPVYTSDELKKTTTTLDSLVVLIREDKLTFEEAALKNSDDKFSRQNGGLVSNHDMLEMYNAMDAKLTSTRFPKEELPVSDYRVISTLKVGEISNAFMSEDMKGNELGKTIKLLQIVPSHPASINEDYLALENMALEDKKEKEFNKWLTRKIEAMYVRIDPAFRNGEFENKAWVK